MTIYNSFVYYWTDSLKNMYYIGVHKGTPDDGYICSSEPMKEEYKLRPDDFSRSIIQHGTQTEMWSLETSILKFVDAKRNPMFYNRTNGHKSFYMDKTHSSVARNKISLAHKGKIPWNKDKKHSEETKNKISVSGKGRKHSEETKLKMSISAIGKKKIRIKSTICSTETRKKLSDETKKKLSDCAKGNKNRLGTSQSIETRKKISQTMTGRKLSVEHKNKLSIFMTEKYKKL